MTRQETLHFRGGKTMLRYAGRILVLLLSAAVLLSCAAFAKEGKTDAAREKEVQGTADVTGGQDPDKGDGQASQAQKLADQVKKAVPVILGMAGENPLSRKEWILDQVKKFVKNPDQYPEDFWDSVFGTGADGISKEGDSEETGTVELVMELPDPVRMPDTYSISYQRMDKEKKETVTLLERDADGNIHFLDGEEECVFVKTEEGFRMYPVLPDGAGFGKWDGVLLSARSVRRRTDPFWNCADQTFIKWLGADLTEETEYLGRPCGLYHAQPGTITFTYECDMVIDDETGICLCYTADELLKGAVFNITDDDRIEISIGDYDIGGDEMEFYCTAFETEDVSFEVPKG